MRRHENRLNAPVKLYNLCHGPLAPPENLFLPRIKAARLAAARARRKPADKKRTAWEFGELYWGRSATLFRNGLAILAVGFGAYILYQSIIPKVISITPISVPKGLADSGYTADVAAERLQSALNDIVTRAHSLRKGPDVARQSDLPSIVVPSTSLSIEAVAAQIRRFLGIESRSNVSGEITAVDEKLWLRLRMNGQDLYASAAGVDPKHPDELFAAAAEKVFEETDPYILAASLSDTEPKRCLEIARKISSDRPQTDPAVPWAHNLAGNVLSDQRESEEAIAEYKKAIDLDPRAARPHNNLGAILRDQGKIDDAIAEYKKAIDLDPRFALPHRNLSVALRQQGKNEAADAELKKALDLEQKP